MSFRLNLIRVKRATVIVALFVFFQTSFANTLPPRESYKEIIEKARNLSLQKDRGQAINLLKLALKKEAKKSLAQKELIQALVDLTSMFFSEKAQQLFELGLSLKGSDPAMSMNKLLEAQKNEPDNLGIEIATHQIAISQNECSSVTEKINKNRDLTIYIEEYRLVFAQALLCSGKTQEYLLLKAQNDPKSISLPAFWSVLEQEYLFKAGQLAKVIDLADQGAANPESYYWRWRAEVDLKLKGEKTAQKYLNSCKTLNSRQLRELNYEPNLCRRTTEVETYLKKNNNTDS